MSSIYSTVDAHPLRTFALDPFTPARYTATVTIVLKQLVGGTIMPEKKPSLPAKREKRARQQKSEKETSPSSNNVRRATNSKRSSKRQARSLRAGLAVMGGR